MNFFRVVAMLAVVLVAMATFTEAKPLLRFFGGRRGGRSRGNRGGNSLGVTNGINGLIGDAYADVNNDIFPVGYPNPLGFVG